MESSLASAHMKTWLLSYYSAQGNSTQHRKVAPFKHVYDGGMSSVFQLRMVASVSPPKSLFYTGKAQNTGQLMRLDGRLSDKPGEA